MPAQLIALNEGPNILLDKPILLVGRHPECDIQIDSRKISRRHCCIAQVEDCLIVRDLGSTNGIRINGVRYLEGKLHCSDELTIGNSRYRVRLDAVDPEYLKDQRAVRAELVNDALLESSDEPIPLEDEDSDDVPLKATPARRGTELRVDHGKDSEILPEHLELAPMSKVRPPHPPK